MAERNELGRVRVIRTVLIGLMASLVVNALIGIGLIVRGEFGQTEGRVLATSLSLAVFTVMGIPGAMQWERHGRVGLGWFCVLGAALSFCLVVVAIWRDGFFGNEGIVKATVTIVVLAFWGNHTALLLFATSRQAVLRLTMALTFGVMAVVAGISILAVWTEDISDLVGRILAALIVLDVLGSLAVPVLSRLHRQDATRASKGEA